MLKTDFVPTAIDQAYQRRQKDTEGEFYRKIAGQGPRSNFKSTTQGFYVATPAGKLLLYNNNRNVPRMRGLIKKALAEYRSSGAARTKVAPLKIQKVDPRYNVSPPEGGLVVRVQAKVLDGYEESTSRWRHIFQSALSRDNLWISRGEHQALARGELPSSVKERIARYHLIDNTRGEPPMWKKDEIRKLDLKLKDGRLSGKVHLETAGKDRGFEGNILGFLETKGDRVSRFDLVVAGEFWGEGTYTRGAPKGKFPLAISFTLADGSDAADRVPPQGSRGWVQGYLSHRR